MDRDTVKLLIHACQEATRVVKLLPQLPDGMTPRHIGVIDTIHELAQQGTGVRVSDVSRQLNVTRPGITKLIGELEQRGLVEKRADSADRRVIWVALTALGEEYYHYYIYCYHGRLAEHFSEEDTERFCSAAETIHRFHEAMRAEMLDPFSWPPMPEKKKKEITAE